MSLKESLRVMVLDTESMTRNSYIISAVADAFRRNTDVEHVVETSLGRAVTDFRAHRCNLFVAVGGAGNQSQILTKISALARWSVLWTTEDPYDLRSNVRYSRSFDAIYTNDSSSLRAYNGRASQLSLAGSLLFQDLPVIENDRDYKYDVTFVGTAWPNRVDEIETLLRKIGGEANFKIGLSTNPFLPPIREISYSGWIDWRTSNHEFAKIANRSRVNLGLGRSFTASDKDRPAADSPPPRLFETALAGGYQVFLGNPSQIAGYYELNEEVSVCSGIDEVASEIKWAIQNPELRITRAKAARERTLRTHLYDHRVTTMIADMGTSRRTLVSVTTRGKPVGLNVLIVTHNYDGQKPGGGIEKYQLLFRRLRQEFRIHYLFPITRDNQTVGLMLALPSGNTIKIPLPYSVHENTLHDTAIEQQFAKVLSEYAIELVHFQHLLHLSLSLPMISRSVGIRNILTVHDYYLVCKRFNLIDFRGVFCHANKIAISTCDVCLDAAERLPAGSQARRRNFISKMLEAVDLFITNTAYSRNFLAEIYGDLEGDRVRVLEMCAPGLVFQQSRSKRKRDGSLRVLVPGNFTDAKGGDQVVRLMNLMRHDNVIFTLAGRMDEKYSEIVNALSFTNVVVHGQYGSEEVPELFSAHDVSLHLSIWPETYVITLSEAWAFGLVPIVSSLGALGERVVNGKTGYVVDPYDVGRVADLFRSLSENAQLLDSLKTNIASNTVQSVQGHIRGLSEIYYEVLAEDARFHPSDLERGAPVNISFQNLGFRTNAPRWDTLENIWDGPIQERLGESSGNARSIEILNTTIPAQYAHLPILDVEPAEIDRYCHIEKIRFDVQVGSGSLAAVLYGAASYARVEGWAHHPGHGRLLETFCCFHNGLSSRYYLCGKTGRSDVAAVVVDSSGSETGFSVEFNIRDANPGVYWLDILCVYDGKIFRFARAGRVDLLQEREYLVRKSFDAGLQLPYTYEEMVGLNGLTSGGEFFLDRVEDVSSEVEEDAGNPASYLELMGWAYQAGAEVPIAVACVAFQPEPRLFPGQIIRRHDLRLGFDDARAIECGFRIKVPSELRNGDKSWKVVQFTTGESIGFPVDLGEFK